MSGQESPVGATHNEHICVIHLTAFENLLRSILSIHKHKTGQGIDKRFPIEANKPFLPAETRVIKLAKY